LGDIDFKETEENDKQAQAPQKKEEASAEIQKVEKVCPDRNTRLVSH